MTLADAFAAVIAAPGDDAPRRRYAELVAASDPERAELIDRQLTSARCRRTCSPAPDDLWREHVLKEKRGAEWAANLHGLVSGWVYLRGFVDWIMIDAEWFLESAGELYQRAPILHLDLSDVGLVTAELFASPHLQRIVSLGLLRNDLDDAAAEIIARSPHLGNLTWLDLGLNRIGAAGLEALAASDRLPRLGYLGFSSNRAPDPTPTHADGYDATSTRARELQAKYGPREWLDAHPRPTWPPPRDAVWYSTTPV